METLYPTSYELNSNLLNRENPYWTKEENKKFESALAIYDKDTPDRWLKVAAMIPGKTVFEVIKQYRELEEDVIDIEEGRVPIPGYFSSSLSLDSVDNRNSNMLRKRSLGTKGSENGRKKGIPWTEDEHRRFLMGLLKCGKGDWRNISRNFVLTKTPTQVASHAQKYFIRLHSGWKDNKRPSIHDITILNLREAAQSNDPNSALPEQHSVGASPETSSTKLNEAPGNRPNDGRTFMVFNSASASDNGNVSMTSPHDVCSANAGLQGYNLHGGNAFHGAYIRF